MKQITTVTQLYEAVEPSYRPTWNDFKKGIKKLAYPFRTNDDTSDFITTGTCTLSLLETTHQKANLADILAS